jgi:hypothetical protein
MHYRLCELQSINLFAAGERRKISVQEIDIKRDIMSDNYRIFSKEFFYLRQDILSCRSSFQITDGESGDESYNMFQFICFFIRFDQRLIFSDDFPGLINL